MRSPLKHLEEPGGPGDEDSREGPEERPPDDLQDGHGDAPLADEPTVDQAVDRDPQHAAHRAGDDDPGRRRLRTEMERGQDDEGGDDEDLGGEPAGVAEDRLAVDHGGDPADAGPVDLAPDTEMPKGVDGAD